MTTCCFPPTLIELTLWRGVEIRETRLGHGLFASRDFPAEAVVGEIEGELVEGEGLWFGLCDGVR